jgi:hypothetical protein
MDKAYLTSTESLLDQTPFLSPTQPHHTLDTPPTSPAQPITPLQIQTPPITPQASDAEEDMPNNKDFFFYRNGHMGKNPQDFIKKFESKDLADMMLEEHKTTAFSNRLKSGNTTEEWFEAIPMGNRDSWAKVKAASLRSTHDKSTLLKGHILKEDKLGLWQEEDGRDELSHVLWANKILTLANDIPNPAGVLIPKVYCLLLEVIRDRIGSDFTTWEDFANTIKTIYRRHQFMTC